MLGKDHRRTRVANAYYSLFMAIGNILGYAAGSYSSWYRVFAFTMTPACNISCANLKSAFYLDIFFIAVTTYISIQAAHEKPLSSSGAQPVEEGAGESGAAGEAFLWELFGTFRYFSTPVWTILCATALTWIGWFPFLLFDTDWMGREIYGGEPNEGPNYDIGVRMGAMGLLLNSVVLGITSVLMERLCRKRGAGFVWGISNILMAVCFIAMLVVTYQANKIGYIGKELPSTGIVIAALTIFTILGFPLAVSCSISCKSILFVLFSVCLPCSLKENSNSVVLHGFSGSSYEVFDFDCMISLAQTDFDSPMFLINSTYAVIQLYYYGS